MGTYKEYKIEDYDKILEFITGGNAIFTIKNELKGTRFTYKFKKNNKNTNVFWVYVLCMANNESSKSYKFLGGFSIAKGFLHSQQAQIKIGNVSVKSVNWFCKKLLKRDFPDNFGFYHMSHCARCGRMLTTPESIINGYGPECIKASDRIRMDVEDRKNEEAYKVKKLNIEEVEKPEPIVEVEPKSEEIILKPEPTKKVVWYQTVLNFFGKN